MTAVPPLPPVELGLQMCLSDQGARHAAARLDAAVLAHPWLRVLGGRRDGAGSVVHLAATLGSPEAIKSAEPEVQVVVGGLADLLSDLADCDPSFGPAPQVHGFEACTSAAELVARWAA